MSKIEALIQKLCPDGVPSVKLGEVCKIMNGKDYKHLAKGDIPVYGSGGIMTHVDEFAYDKPSVLIPRKGSIGNLFYTDKPFWTVDTLYWTKIDEKLIVPKFFYYLMTTKDLGKLNMAAGVPSLTQSMLYKIEFPLPPLPVQEEVVRILDKFSALEAELEAELEARKKQYEHYRNHLLNFNDNPNVKWLKLGEVCKKTSKINWKLTTREYSYIDLASVDRANHKISECTVISKENAPSRAQQIVKCGDILFGTTRPTLMRFCYVPEIYDNQICSTGYCVIRVDNSLMNSHFVYHYLFTKEFKRYVETHQQGANYPSISDKEVMNFEIPLPSLTEQERIVGILDRFEALTTSLQEGLPAEIAARRKQYEHYRDRLLSFEVKS